MIEDKFMRVLLMFDVPTKSKKEQKLASKFRNNLIKLGYFMLQFSVYMRICKG
ncbi:CRISPR-associated endonuclease Cas2, partial [Campylobacter coli]|nr:CRISPR-associated endonuclease Cas2 [Campylobacter coli]